MRVFGRRFALHCAALATALGLSLTIGSGTAQAVTVTPGGAFVAVAPGFSIVMPAGTFTCNSSNLSGTFAPSSTPTVGAINSVSFTTCLIGLLPASSVTVSGLPWRLNITGVNPSNPSQYLGTLSGVSIKVSSAACTVTYTGSPTIIWTNPNSLKFQAGATLVASSANCLGLVVPGTAYPVTASYTVSPSQVIS